MRIMTVEWPDDVDAVLWNLEAKIDGQTYRQTYCGYGSWRYKGSKDLRTQFVQALEGFATYVSKSARITDDEVRRLKEMRDDGV